MSTKNLHITVKSTHQVYWILISCHFFLTKVHSWSSFLLWYQVSYICLEYIFSLSFTTSSKEWNIYVKVIVSLINQEGLVMTRLKELGRSGNYKLWNSTWPRLWVSSQRGGTFWNYFVVVQPKQRMFRITRWRSSGVPIEKIRTIWTNFVRYASTPNGNMSSPRCNQTWRWAAYERSKALVSSGFR